MRILYLSTHTILEYDEISLFTEMNHEVFSMGAYQTANADNSMRPAVPGLFQSQHLIDLSLQCSKENLHPELIDWADVIVVMHNARMNPDDHPQPWIAGNWDKLKGKKVVWRSIGQSTRQIEESLKQFRDEGLKIIRYSPKEALIPAFAGSDAIIRFYKNPDEYKDWEGNIERVVNVSQALFGGKDVKSRGDHMGLNIFNEVVEGLDWKVFGPDNENAGDHDGGRLSFSDLKSMLRFNRVFFYTGTRPASYTLSLIEAMMTGIPIVSVGNAYGNEIYVDQKTFELPDIIGENGKAGFWSDSPAELKEYCKKLLQDHDFARQMGANGRARAVELFGKDNIKRQWEEFFEKCQ